jgi:hypothetical protein
MTNQELEEFEAKFEAAVLVAMAQWRKANPNPPPRTTPVGYFYEDWRHPDGLHVYEIEAHPATIAKLRMCNYLPKLIENPDMPEGKVSLGLRV